MDHATDISEQYLFSHRWGTLPHEPLRQPGQLLHIYGQTATHRCPMDPRGHYTLHTVMFLLLLSVLLKFSLGLEQKKVGNDYFIEGSFKLLCVMKCLNVSWQASFNAETFLFTQTSSLPCGTHLSIHSAAPASSFTKSPSSIQVHGTNSWPFPLPCLCFI